MFFLLGAATAILCSCSRSLTIFTARWYSVCCFTGIATLALLLLNFSVFPNVSVYRIDVVDGVLHDHRVLLSSERPSFAVLLLNARLWTFDSCILRLSKRSTQPSENLVFGDWVADAFPCASSEIVAHHFQTCPIFWCAMVPAPSNLFGNSKLYEWLNDLAAFINCHSSVLFWEGCQSAKFLSTSAENCSQPATFGTIITLSIDFAAFVFSDDLRGAGDCSQQHCVHLCWSLTFLDTVLSFCGR